MRMDGLESRYSTESLMTNLEAIQFALQKAKLDGWLFYDHHHRDPIAYRILGLSDSLHVTRRWFYLIPAHGEPRKLVHRIEQGRLDPLPGAQVPSTPPGRRLEAQLAAMLENSTRLAMQYSPRNAIMYVSLVDAGTVELLRELGKEIVSSADLVSHFEAVLTEKQIASHYAAQHSLDAILAEGFRRYRPARACRWHYGVRHGWLAARSHAARRSGVERRTECFRQPQQLRFTL